MWQSEMFLNFAAFGWTIQHLKSEVREGLSETRETLN